MQIWDAVPEMDKRDIHEDVVFALAKREKEESKILKKQNVKHLGETLDSISEITYRTTWTEAQQILLENVSLSENNPLMSKILSH